MHLQLHVIAWSVAAGALYMTVLLTTLLLLKNWHFLSKNSNFTYYKIYESVL